VLSHVVEKHAVAAYVKLAQGVVGAAVREFLAEPSPSLLGPERLTVLTHAIQAGEFLLERTDRITQYWFALMGADLVALRSSRQMTAPHQRLADLRSRATAMQAVLRPRVI
jgi:hypothetical protein